MSYQKKYYALCEMYQEITQEKKALLKQCDQLQKEKLHLMKDVGALRDRQTELDHQVTALESRQQNCDRNRQFIDDATNYLGPLAKRLLYKLSLLQAEADELQHMHDAYYKVGVRWPWENGQ